ncbi:hypothetical protein IVA80_11010 [Bradyrhizobium sp. 139]|uniref:hypothetical protein n=1 Tax=Bradyrhizobium sp. 139 TaxID=2782616 RepID=UPI001FF8EA5C|nr:hypothetical protein [Bradyrhizobium sp. 139]MCK1741380.1 hypothetical protein [Bradyrhizobium sp. 139]
MADIAKRVEQFVKLRDLIKAKNDEHKKAMKPYNETLEQLNALLLAHLNSVNGNSVATDTGTVYRTEKKSASLQDAQAFMDYVIQNNAWDLIDRKANVSAVEDFINQNNSPPPGVNWSSTYVAGVRRA